MSAAATARDDADSIVVLESIETAHYRGPSQTGTAVPVTLSRTVVLFDPEDSKSLQCRATLTVTMAGGALSHSLNRTYTFAVPMDGNFTSKLECVYKALAAIGFFDKSLSA